MFFHDKNYQLYKYYTVWYTHYIISYTIMRSQFSLLCLDSNYGTNRLFYLPLPYLGCCVQLWLMN